MDNIRYWEMKKGKGIIRREKMTNDPTTLIPLMQGELPFLSSDSLITFSPTFCLGFLLGFFLLSFSFYFASDLNFHLLFFPSLY